MQTRSEERAYAVTATAAAGGWLTTATALGSGRAPLPTILVVAVMVLGVPWWAHRRRRARVRVDRAIHAWPDLAEAVGLDGSRVMSAVVDTWGWRARMKLRPGQSVADVVSRVPAIESALGTRPGAVRVEQDPAHAGRCTMRVLAVDPHAGAIPWPGPAARSLADPIELGVFEDATKVRLSFLRRHALIGGTTDSGKSGVLNVVLGNLAACSDVVLWGIDLKGGMELRPWAPCLARLATTPDEATLLLADAVAVLDARAHASGRDAAFWSELAGLVDELGAALLEEGYVHNDARWHRLTPDTVYTIRDRLTPRARLLVWPDLSADVSGVLDSLPDEGLVEVVWQDHAGRITSHLIDESDQPAVRARLADAAAATALSVYAEQRRPLMAAVLPDSDGVLRARWTP